MISLYRGLFSEKQFHIFLHTVNSCDTKIINQNFGYIWREECRKRWSKVDIFYPEGKQCQENNHGFLLIPGDIVDDRKFIDIINDYYKQEDGGMMRKAIRLSNGLSITDTDVEKKYADYVDDLTAKAEKDGKSRLEKDTGKTVGKQDQNANNNNAADDGDGETANTNNKNEDKTTTFEENVCQVDVTLTMYSIERMQDPTDQLSSQNNQ